MNAWQFDKGFIKFKLSSYIQQFINNINKNLSLLTIMRKGRNVNSEQLREIECEEFEMYSFFVYIFDNLNKK